MQNKVVLYTARKVITVTKAYQQRKESNKKYLSTLDEIRIRVPKGKKEEYKELAEKAEKSLNQFIVDCIEKGREWSRHCGYMFEMTNV